MVRCTREGAHLAELEDKGSSTAPGPLLALRAPLADFNGAQLQSCTERREVFTY